MAALIATCISFLALVPLSMWRGFVLIKLWAWFVIPLFALPVLSLPAAMGISLVVGYLTHQAHKELSDKPDYTQLLATEISNGIVIPLFALAIGAIIHAFM